jgi:enoyl-CoA hydratase/carnithine racemase
MTTVRAEAIRPGITLLTLDRPDRLNAMGMALVGDLHDALDAIAADRACRVLILTGAGRAFCAGLDLKDPGRAPGTEGRGPAQAGMVTQ